MNKYVNEMEDYLYNHNYISENNNNIKQQELSIERASCIVQKYRTLTEEKDKEIERLNNIITELEKALNTEVILRYHGKDNAKENKIFNAGGMLYRDYIIDKLEDLKEETYNGKDNKSTSK